jgi:beta-glucosidase
MEWGLEPHRFVWGTGIEDTFVPQTRPGHRALDEYQLMGHYTHWREDLDLVRDLGVRAIRWGVPWYRVEPIEGEFDWRFTDEVLEHLLVNLQVVPIVDLMHYGCPFWLRREFASDEYPLAVARYAQAFAERYRGRVKWYTPHNEPLVTGLFCGKRGLWPPYLRGDTGYLRVILQVVKGILLTVDAVKGVDPEAVMVHVEASGMSRAAREDLEPLVVEERLRSYLTYDLLAGRVSPEHPLYTWLVRHGAPVDDLAWIAGHRVDLELMGLNFYPQWSATQLYLDGRGRLSYRPVEQDGAGFIELIEGYYARYGVPIVVTETSARGSLDVRARWMEASVAAVKALRARGVPVVGYIWFPLFTMIDWRYRFGRGPIEEYRLDLGLYTMGEEAEGRRWKATPLVEQYHSIVSDPEEAVGVVGAAEDAVVEPA